MFSVFPRQAEGSQKASLVTRFASLFRATAPTIGQVVQRAASSLSSVTDAPRLEAEVLLCHVLGITRAELLAHPERRLTQTQLVRYAELIRRREEAYPLPYLTGRAEFFGLDFEVTPDVLIPRPETEQLVELALAYEPRTVIDVGTGCGCIAIALAVCLPRALFYAIDLSPAALAVAQRNAERHGVRERIRFLVSDLLMTRPEPFGEAGSSGVDLIVSNPPYVATSEWASLPPSVREYEPRLALDGGANGLEVVRRLLVQAPAVLRPGGVLLMEIGASQGESVMHLARTLLPSAVALLHRDLAGRDRVLEVRL